MRATIFSTKEVLSSITPPFGVARRRRQQMGVAAAPETHTKKNHFQSFNKRVVVARCALCNKFDIFSKVSISFEASFDEKSSGKSCSKSNL
jgi:hypothetical protein